MESLINISIWGVVKWFSVIGLLIYIVFAGVIVRQVHLMTQTLRVSLDTPIKMATYIHLAFSIFVFLLALIIL